MTILSTILAKLAAALTALAMTIGLIHAPASTDMTPVPIGISSSTSSVGVETNTTVSADRVLTDKNWSVGFTLRPEWNVNEILDVSNSLHQMQISSSKDVIFISKNEAIGLSGDLSYTTETRTIAGKSVEVRTYAKPNAQFAYYQTFTLPEPDGNYNFLLKSTTADTSILNDFIRSIVVK